MKFLIFNVVVSAALVYLLMGETYRSAAVEDVVERARDTVVTAVDDAERLLGPDGKTDGPVQATGVEPAVSPQAGEPTVVAARQPGPVVTEASDFQVAAPPRAIEREPLGELPLDWDPGSVFPGWPTTQPLPRVDDPAVEQRRAEVLDREPVGGNVSFVDPGADTPAFMTARERQRELHSLAEEMELLFATEIAR